MDYDAYGRPLRGGYFEDSDTRYHDPHESLNSTHHKWNHAQQRYSPPLSTTSTTDRMANAAEPSIPIHKAQEGVTPDLVAQIKEQVMKEGR
jgi:hypothetical protein